MATITPIQAITLDALTQLSQRDGRPQGRVLQARVMEMLSSNLARLSINGQAVDVKTTQPLQIGSTLNLKVDWQNGELKLLTEGAQRRPGQPAPQLPGGQGGGSQTAQAAQLAQTARNAAGAQAAQLGQGAQPAGGGALVQAGQGAAQGPDAARLAQYARGAQAAEVAQAARGPQAPQSANVAQAVQSAAQSAQHIAGNVTAPIKTAIAKIQMMAVEAVFSGSKGFNNGVLARPVAGAPLSDAAAAAARPQTPDAAAARAAGQGAAASGAAQNAPAPREAVEARQSAAPMPERTDAAQRQAAADLMGGQTRAERLVGYTVELPFFIPGNEAPLRLQIFHEDEAAANANGEQRAPSWMVRFGAEAGSLGMLHAAVSLVDGHVGVQLWAEREDTAAWFRENSRQLQDALEASQLKLDHVRVAHGAPPEGKSG